jgi:hypothetical protein
MPTHKEINVQFCPRLEENKLNIMPTQKKKNEQLCPR